MARSEGVGPVTYGQLLQRFGSATEAVERLPELARRGGRRRAIRVPSEAQAAEELAAVEALGATLLTRGEARYPLSLDTLEAAPSLLCLRGDLDLLERPILAIVGARNASANGRRLAERFAVDLADAGYVIASGLARGIDTAAHRGALASGTIAAVAGGIDVVYPPENRELQGAIGERGLLVSEMPPGAEPKARHFPKRNRIIAGLSRGVVVVEAALRSGSLITARQALDQGREIFAVPGSPLDPRARGCNALIKDSAAQLVESAEDVLKALEIPLTRPISGGFAAPRFSGGGPADAVEIEPPAALDRGRGALLELLGPDPVPVDELVRRCHLSPAAVSTLLLELELAGRVERHPGHRVSLRMSQNGLAEEPAATA